MAARSSTAGVNQGATSARLDVVLRITASDSEITITDQTSLWIWHRLAHMIPADRVNVFEGPGVVITVPGHGADELAPGIRSDIERVLGCSVVVSDAPEESG